MAYSNALHQPSLLELAQDGNCRALTYWMNSLLSPQGIQIQVQPAPDQFFRILVDFRRPCRRDTCLRLRDRLARLICYRLWTLNSGVIQGVRIVARIADDPKVLWQLSVRINSPAVAKLRRSGTNLRQNPRPNTRQNMRQNMRQLRFQVFRSLFLSSITLAGIWIGYRLFYVELGRLLSQAEPLNVLTPRSLSAAELPNGGIVRMPLPPSQTDFTVPKQAAGTVISQVDLPNAEKLIALTFDNGPDPAITPQVLDILQQYNIRATFFMSGVNVDQQPDLARRVVAEGHAVGNRGWSLLSDSDHNVDAEHEVDDTAKLIETTTGAKTALFRPATGQVSSSLVSQAKRKNNAVILWSVDAQAPLVAAPIVLDNVLRNAQPGRIVLLHDGSSHSSLSSTVQALPQIITALQTQGYQFVTVPQLLQRQRLLPEALPDTKPDTEDTKDAKKIKASPAPEAAPDTKPGTKPEAKPDSLEEKPALQTPNKASQPERQLRKKTIALMPAVG